MGAREVEQLWQARGAVRRTAKAKAAIGAMAFVAFAAPELVARIDWDSLAVENIRLHIAGLDAKEADVLLSAQLAGKPALLYIVFEHQSPKRRCACCATWSASRASI
jgi:hypothetical protein